MAEHGLVFYDASAPPPRPALVPVSAPPDLDELLIGLMADWVDQARRRGRVRRAAGLPVIALSWENALVNRYESRLGRQGADIALALLALSRAPEIP